MKTLRPSLLVASAGLFASLGLSNIGLADSPSCPQATPPCHTQRETIPTGRTRVLATTAVCFTGPSTEGCPAGTARAHAEFTARIEREILVVLSNSCTGDVLTEYHSSEVVSEPHGFNGSACYPNFETNDDAKLALLLISRRCEEERKIF